MVFKTKPIKSTNSSWLSWPAWQRALVLAPLVALLWLAVLWANLEVF